MPCLVREPSDNHRWLGQHTSTLVQDDAAGSAAPLPSLIVGEVDFLETSQAMVNVVKLKYNYALKENDLLNFDFVIGQPNKSLENSINMNIPTLIYETPKEMYSKWIKDYDKDILCNNNNIYKKFKTIKKNLYAFQNKIKKQKNCLFYKSDFSKYNLIKKDINDLCQK